MSTPLKPHWKQPSHPSVQQVVINEHEFTSKSLSKVTLPPFALYAKMEFPPCTLANEATYATVQFDRTKHLNLNSDLLYINHSCEPSLIFDTGNRNIIAGPNGLRVGEELTFFYPSTEWDMAQPFDCLCGKPTCRGRISGAKDMTPEQLQGLWINGHIRQLLEEKAAQEGKLSKIVDAAPQVIDPTAQALRDALSHAEQVVKAAQLALHSYIESSQGNLNSEGRKASGIVNGLAAGTGHSRRGPTSRELSGEMGGDTAILA